MPETDLESLVARAESGDWEAVGQLIAEVERRYGQMVFRMDAFRRSDAQWQVNLLRMWGSWAVAPTLPAAITRAAREALEGEKT